MDVNRVDALSPREYECLLLVGQGKAGGVIATMLGLSESTVKGYIATGMVKLGARTRREAGYLVLEHNRSTPSFRPGPNLRVADGDHRRSFNAGPLSDDDTRSLITESREERGRQEFAHDRLQALRTLAMVAAIVAALLIVGLALKPIVQNARDLANAVQPDRPH